MIWVYIGLALFFSMNISEIVNLALQYLTGGMYGPFFKKFSPSVFVALTYIFSLGIPLVVAIIFCKQTNLKNRLPARIPGRGEFILGGLMILLPQALQIASSSIQDGSATFALFSFAGPIISWGFYLGKILIFIGAIRLLMAVKPSSEYEYPGVPSESTR